MSSVRAFLAHQLSLRAGTNGFVTVSLPPPNRLPVLHRAATASCRRARAQYRAGSSGDGSRPPTGAWERFWVWTARQGREMPSPRFSGAWLQEAALRSAVFAVRSVAAIVLLPNLSLRCPAVLTHHHERR